jgi:hypothetical protein
LTSLFDRVVIYSVHTAHSRNQPTVSVGSAASFRIDHPDLLQNEHSSMASTEIQRIA